MSIFSMSGVVELNLFPTGIRRIAFVAIDFDDFLGEYKEDYYAQIDGHLEANPVPGVEIFFYNSRTAFHRLS